MSKVEYTRIDGVDSGLGLIPVFEETKMDDGTQEEMEGCFSLYKDNEDEEVNKNFDNVKEGEDESPQSRDFTPLDSQQMEFGHGNNDSSAIHRRIVTLIPETLLPSRKNCVSVLAVISILVLGALLFFILFPNQHSPSTSQAKLQLPGSCEPTSNWKDWSSITNAFAFGDSWTTTAFDYMSTQPSPSEPMGNPPFPGETSSNATNWIGYLTTTYNASLLLTHNLAVAGTTLDNHITDSYPVPVTEQIYNRFIPKYGEGYWTPWKPSSTLFIMFIGINDVMIMNPVTGDELISVDQRLFKTHIKLLTSLWGVGARNFLLLNIPPLERVWQPASVPQSEKDKYGSDARMYNRRIEKVAGALKTKFEDVNVWVFDVHTLINQALDDPHQFEQMKRIKNTTEFCEKYKVGTPMTDYFDPECGIPVNEYFWLDALHPTYPIHDVIAEHVVKMLEKGPNVC